MQSTELSQRGGIGVLVETVFVKIIAFYRTEGDPTTSTYRETHSSECEHIEVWSISVAIFPIALHLAQLLE
jgi:hypothetical protein